MRESGLEHYDSSTDSKLMHDSPFYSVRLSQGDDFLEDCHSPQSLRMTNLNLGLGNEYVKFINCMR